LVVEALQGRGQRVGLAGFHIDIFLKWLQVLSDLVRERELVHVDMSDPEHSGAVGQVLHIALIDFFGLDCDRLFAL
jgi:hypothetical protein